jgi:phage terminase large subunit
LFWDIGGAGAKADACAIWVVQWPGQEIRVLDYTEGQGQVLGYYEVIPNQGAGAVAMRIEAVRRLFPRCWFNEKTTEAGIEALGFYHEKKDEQRSIGVGPEHDLADAFGLMAIAYEEPSRKARFNRPIKYPQLGIV